jgi:hypothetical protein
VPAELAALIEDLMAKDKQARPASASEVTRRLAPIRALVEQAESQRRTAFEFDPESESSRATIFESDVHVEPHQPVAATAGPSAESGRVTVLTTDDDVASPVGNGTAGSSAAPVAPEPGAAPVRFGPGLSGGSAPPPVPDWAKPSRPKRRSRRWLSVLSTFVTLAIIAAVAVILWLRTHEVFKVTSVAVAPAAAPGDKCNVTVDVVGSVVTNGHGGEITYQWIRNGDITSPVATAVVGTGQTIAQLHLSWYLHGRGTYQAVAELRVLTPQVASAKTTFTYSCH